MAVRVETRWVPGTGHQKRRKIQLRSRNNNDFNVRYPDIVKALTPMPEDKVVDGEIVALDAEGRPSHLRHSRFVASREDRNAKDVNREA
jgi:ATP-dependent DNA ligase